MTEIKIEKKKPIWPWILLILIILGAIYFFWYSNDQKNMNSDDVVNVDTINRTEENLVYDNDTRDATSLYTGNYGTVRKEEAMADYFSFVDKMDNKTDNDFYRTAFFKLITATKREAEIENVDVNANISAAMESAEKLTNVSTTTGKADNVKKAASEISKALKTIQQQKFDTLSDNATDLEKSVTAIEGSQDIAKQETNIDTFFDKAARLLQKMNENNNNY